MASVGRVSTTTGAKSATVRRASKAAEPHAPRPRRARDAAEFIDPVRQLEKISDAEDDPAPLSRRERSVEATLPDAFFSGYTGAPLTEQDFADAAATLRCEVAAVKAVAQVESAGAGFDDQRRPTILYERHVFARCTRPQGKFDAQAPALSGLRNPYPKGGYGTKDEQYVKIARALGLDHDAALKAASWGKFQVLGENHVSCGFAKVVDFARAMTVSEGGHLKAFVNFVSKNAKLSTAIRDQNWAAFAAAYNGPAYATFSYDKKLAAAYAQHSG